MATLDLRPSTPPASSEQSPPRPAKRFRFGAIVALHWILRLVCAAALGWLVLLEVRTSFLQSAVFSHLAGEMQFTVEPGPSSDIRFPQTGPYDERLGYVGLPSFIERLNRRHYLVERQAVLSHRLDQFIDAGGYAVYPEKAHAGLALFDRAGTPLYEASYPAWGYVDFQAIPPIVANSLLFIEDRYLLDTRYPQRNPAVEWNRFLLAAGGRALDWLDPALKQGGASTLATQTEKFQHSPAGRTGGVGEKLRQMATASARAYLDGPDTTAARRRIITAYLNSTPLSSRPGDGEIIGVGNGLWAWYGTDFAEANRVLSGPASTPAELSRKATIYKQVVSLLLAQRRPSYYLMIDHQALEALTERYLRVLCTADVIDPPLRDAALRAELRFRAVPQTIPPHSFTGHKAVDAVRTELLALLRTQNLYSLDRFDLTARTTIDAGVQEQVSGVLSRLGQPDFVKSLGLVGQNLLGAEDPSHVTYSVVLYERGTDRNYVRIHADSLDEPFDINSGAKLILGSTAKLRTLATYLNIVTELHDRYASQSPRELLTTAAQAGDPLSRWAAAHLAASPDRRLQPMLDAAMQRRYSASPHEAFFTGGGRHVFENFEKTENGMVPTVEWAFEHSVNLAFVRLMRDITHYYLARNGERMKALAADGEGTGREAYLQRFADQEGRRYLNRFYDDYRGQSDEEALALLAGRTRPVAYRLAVAFRSVRPQASVAALREFLAARSPGLAVDEDTANSLYAKYADDQFSLNDRGYLAGVHPLELWLVAYLHNHPGATRGEILAASTALRQEVYAWLFKTRNAHKQDIRIRTLLEEDAFDRILQDWRRQGYPFGQLVPSLATAIGSSGDRPDALAQLVGVILNDGVMVPTVDLDRLHFAAKTPYDTEMILEPPPAKRVFAPEVAQTLRQALMGVVAEGTGARLRNVYVAPNGTPLLVGGKTGTGDNRFDSFAAGGRLIESRVVDRTATFAFFLGDRFFGTITAYVPGAQAADYRFTSALAVQLLKGLAPQFGPLINAGG
jgi:membrane peptidoglycan carboxypeptidase